MGPTETRHSHGNLLHDHEGGNVPHDHDGHIVPTAERARQRRASERPPFGPGMAVLGVLVTIVSGLGWAWSAADANTCKNAFVGALDSGGCTKVTGIHDIATLGLCAGIIIIALGIVIAVSGRTS